MQHSPLTYSGSSSNDLGLPGSRRAALHPCPGRHEGDIQKATDIGAVGIIIPMVDTVEKVQTE